MRRRLAIGSLAIKLLFIYCCSVILASWLFAACRVWVVVHIHLILCLICLVDTNESDHGRDVVGAENRFRGFSRKRVCGAIVNR